MPNRIEPTGRMTKPTPKTAKALSSDMVLSSPGKKSCDIVPATIALRFSALIAVASVATVMLLDHLVDDHPRPSHWRTLVPASQCGAFDQAAARTQGAPTRLLHRQATWRHRVASWRLPCS